MALGTIDLVQEKGKEDGDTEGMKEGDTDDMKEVDT